MRTLNLQYQKELQGNFELQSLNLLLVFQVNCPGCFFYALPLFSKLYDQFKDEVGFLALSTAFEDFDLNTEANTKALIEQGTLVGETSKALQQHGIEERPFKLDFPMAFDRFVEDKAALDALALTMCEANPNYQTWPTFEQEAMLKRVQDYLNGLENVSSTFTSNALKGTPSFVLFDDAYKILGHWFGHVNFEQLEAALKPHKTAVGNE